MHDSQNTIYLNWFVSNVTFLAYLIFKELRTLQEVACYAISRPAGRLVEANNIIGIRIN